MFREKIRSSISPHYSAAFHVAAPAVVGISLIVLALANLHHVRWWELIFPPFIYVLSNAVEHRAHRLALHRRTPGLTVLYDRHTPIHHRIFVAKDMAIRDSREAALVLLPWFGIVAIFALTTPFTIALWFMERNLACLFVATTHVLRAELRVAAPRVSPVADVVHRAKPGDSRAASSSRDASSPAAHAEMELQRHSSFVGLGARHDVSRQDRRRAVTKTC